jgi:UDP-glucose 4-epimerase
LPDDAYGKSKWLAEQFLKTLESPTFCVSVVRPPMVYGPGVKGNMEKLIALCRLPLPLPFAKVGNQRTMVFVDNLVEMVNALIEKPISGIFVPSDAFAISTDELIIFLRKALGKKAHVFALPSFLGALLKRLRPALHHRLFGSFVINNKKTNQELSFAAPYTTEFGIETMVKGDRTSV